MKIGRKCPFYIKFVFLLFSKALAAFYVKPWTENVKSNKENVKSNKDFESFSM